MWKHCDMDDEYVSLHDCHATRIIYENNALTFVFRDGIWIVKGHPNNELDKTVCTDMAEAKFYLENGDESDITIYVFEENLNKTIREEWELSKLIECVNSGKYTLEFLYQYKGYHSIIIECWLWSDTKPYHRECELKISLSNVKYCWNDLCEDRVWQMHDREVLGFGGTEKPNFAIRKFELENLWAYIEKQLIYARFS